MKNKKGHAKSMRPENDATSIRASISFPPDIYRALQEMAHQKKVSLAWVVREASERYIAGEKVPVRRRGKKADRA